MMHVVYKGRKLPLVELAREHGFHPRTLRSRLARGLSIEQALTRPKRPYPEGVQREIVGACDRCGSPGRPQDRLALATVILCVACASKADAILRRWIDAS